MSTRHALFDFWQTVRRARAATRPGPASPISPAVEVVSGQDVIDAMRQLDAIRETCRRMVMRRATLSAGAAVVPIPGLDVGTDVAILLQLLPKINEEFGLSPAQIEGLDVDTKRVVMMFISVVGSNLVGRIVTRDLVIKILTKLGVRVTTKGIVKFVPFVGQAVSAGISFGAMRMLGNRHIDDCHEVAKRALLGDAARVQTRWTLVRRGRAP